MQGYERPCCSEGQKAIFADVILAATLNSAGVKVEKYNKSLRQLSSAIYRT